MVVDIFSLEQMERAVILGLVQTAPKLFPDWLDSLAREARPTFFHAVRLRL
jgi:hypothetical protein